MIVAAAIRMVAGELGVDPEAISARPHGSDLVVLARWVAIYLCTVSLELGSATQLAPRFGRHRSSLDDAKRRIEDRRDAGDAAFDEWICRMEMRLQRLTFMSTQMRRECSQVPLNL